MATCPSRSPGWKICDGTGRADYAGSANEIPQPSDRPDRPEVAHAGERPDPDQHQRHRDVARTVIEVRPASPRRPRAARPGEATAAGPPPAARARPRCARRTRARAAPRAPSGVSRPSPAAVRRRSATRSRSASDASSSLIGRTARGSRTGCGAARRRARPPRTSRRRAPAGTSGRLRVEHDRQDHAVVLGLGARPADEHRLAGVAAVGAPLVTRAVAHVDLHEAVDPAVVRSREVSIRVVARVAPPVVDPRQLEAAVGERLRAHGAAVEVERVAAQLHRRQLALAAGVSSR